jgi:hypothetical protein
LLLTRQGKIGLDPLLGARVTRDLDVLRSPSWWPDRPFLQVERRTEPRMGQPTCYIRADEVGDVEPVVRASPEWPPVPEVAPSIAFKYENVEEIVSAGWRVLYLLD